MKIAGNNIRSSMGLPREAREAVRQYQEKRETEAEKEPSDPPEAPEPEVDEDFTEDEAPEKEPSPTDGLKSPTEMLEDIGVQLTEDDFHNYLFKGYIEKDVVAIPFPGNPEKNFIVTYRTLTVEDHNLIDEILAEDAKAINMTNDGFSSRRSSLLLAASVHKIAGKSIAKPVNGEDGKPSRKLTIISRRDMLKQLSDHVTDRMIRCQQLLSLAIRTIIVDPKQSPLKKS